jgi:catalase
VEGDVLERAFAYWKAVDADCGKQIEELVRAGGPNDNPGGQPEDAQADASAPVVEDDTHAAR